MTQPPTTHRTPTENAAALARVKALAVDDDPADPDATQPLDVPGGPTGNGAPTHQGAQADPTPAATPVASADLHPRDGDRAGVGRPTRRDGNGRFIAQGRALTRIPPMSAALAQALLDAQAETHRVDTATRTQAVLVAAVAFDDRVRHSGGGSA